MNWTNRSKSRQATSAVLAGGLTAVLFIMLSMGRPGQQRSVAVPSTRITVILPSAIPPPTPQPVFPRTEKVRTPDFPRAARTLKTPSKVERASELAAEPKTTPEFGTPSATQTTTPAVPVESPFAAASSPLKLDAKTIKEAGARSVGAVRRMAESSGQELPDSRLSPLEQFRSSVARAGKSDCLAPNENGSLLSIPIIAYGAVTGKCK